MRFLLFTVLTFLLLACGGSEENEESETSPNLLEDSENLVIIEDTNDVVIEKSIPVYTHETFFTEGKGWGYKILTDGKVYINQPHIPAVAGNNGFSSEDKAIKTAEFAIHKLELGIMPPTISTEELDSLGVLD